MLREVILYPYVSEKSFGHMTGSPQQNNTDGNRLEFIVRRDATKEDIKRAFKHLFDVEVRAVKTRTTKHGKHAIIVLKNEGDADKIATRIGLF